MKLMIKGLVFGYDSRPLLQNVSLRLEKSEILGIIGPNGAGKSTLLRCINGFLQPSSGLIFLNDMAVKDMSLRQLARLMGYVPQNTTRIFPATVFDTVLMGRRPHLNWRCSRADKQKVARALSLMGIEDLAMRDFEQLSGGQQQKVLIAQALAQEVEVLLLDEPTSNLDIRHQLETMNIITDLARDEDLSVVMAIHDLNLASRYADNLLMMKGGKVFASGEPGSVLTIENIREVYGVEASVRVESGRPFVVLISPL